MVAKLIAHGPTRADAIATMQKALTICTLQGITTNAPLHRAITADPAFRAGGVDTNYLTTLLPQLQKAAP